VNTPAAALSVEEVLDLLDRTVVKGLVVMEGGRYRLIESVRVYSREIISLDEDSAARNLHFAFYAELAQDTEGKVRGPEQRKWIALFDDEQENIRAALDWGFRNPALHGSAIEFLYEFTPYDFIKGSFREALHRYEIALKLDASISIDLRSRLVRRAGLMGMYNDDPRSKHWFSLALETAKKSENLSTLADALFTYGNFLHLRGDTNAARPFILDALKKFEELRDVYGQAFATITLASMAAFEERYDDARTLYEDSLRMRKQAGDLRGIGASLSALASLDMKLGKFDEARPLIREGLRLFVDVGTPIDFADSVPRAAWLAALTGHAEIAAQLLGYSDASTQRHGGRRDRTDQRDYESGESAARNVLGLGEYERLWRTGKSLRMDQAFDLAIKALD
jgi:tetratricopeptide (TPR) repeat protein